MARLELVRPLEADFQAVVDAVLRSRGAPTTTDVGRLAPRVAELSNAYNAGLVGDAAHARVPLEARIAFSFARDVPKGAAAVRELIETGALAARTDRPLRIVDLGAGLGAMTWGITRALRARATDTDARVEALLVDEDADALSAAEAIARAVTARHGTNAPPLTIRTRKQRLVVGLDVPEADVVVLGQVLSELDLALDPGERVSRHASLVHDLLGRVVAPDGSLVIVEPALRDRTRHLHAVRDLLLERGATVFAPCLHARVCPMLATEREWCHEDLAVDLPAWLVPLARGAGLRWQGLTFSYLVLRRDGRRLVDEAQSPSERAHVHLRVVSELLRTKGKTEIFACTAAGQRARLRRLDRDAGRSRQTTEAWEKLGRGDIVSLRPGAGSGAAIEPAVDDRGRVAALAEVDVWRAGK